MCDYTKEILDKWTNIVLQKVSIKDKALELYKNWRISPEYKTLDWWNPYNKVKHDRIDNFREANLKNVINALAGLYILEQYYVKYIGDRDGDRDVPNDISSIFKMIDWETRHNVIFKNVYEITKDEIDDMFH